MIRIIFSIPSVNKLYKTSSGIDKAKQRGIITTKNEENEANSLMLLLRGFFGSNYFIMQGTKEYGNKIIVDAIARSSSFDPDDFPPQWDIIGMWSWDGVGEITVLESPKISVWNNYLKDELKIEPHRWSGWPDCIGL